MGDDQESTRRHEAGHQVAAAAVGWTLRGLTAQGGTHLLGCSRVFEPPVPESAWDALDVGQPFTLWPPAVQASVQAQVLVRMAGDTADLYLAPPGVSGRVEPTIAVQAAERVERLVALPEPVPADVTALRVIVNGPGPSDADKIAKLAWFAHGTDLLSAGAWLSWMEAQTRALVAAKAPMIRRLTAALVARHTLSCEQVAALLAG